VKNHVLDPNKLPRLSVDQCLKQDTLGLIFDNETIGQGGRSALSGEVYKIIFWVIGVDARYSLTIEEILCGSECVLKRNFGLRRSDVGCMVVKATLVSSKPRHSCRDTDRDPVS